MDYKNILVSTSERITTIKINRPKKLNALNKETISELGNAIEEADKSSDTRVIILTGTGEKAFVAGADISEFADFDVDQGKQLAAEGQQKLFDKIENCGTPVIAAINGFALGGGLELAMASHIRIASKNAKMGLPETSLGVIPGYGGTQRLPQLVGKGNAFEMIFTAGMTSADKAYDIGLVNHVTDAETLMDKANEIAHKIMNNSPMAIKAAIKAVNAGYQHDLNGYQAEINAFGEAFGTDDFEKGTQAFLNKKKPSF